MRTTRVLIEIDAFPASSGDNFACQFTGQKDYGFIGLSDPRCDPLIPKLGETPYPDCDADTRWRA
jgi:hypothetical protein